MNNGRVKELWGRKFDVVKEGLDQSQVIEYINTLIQQRDILLEQVNSLLSYIKLSKNLFTNGEELASSAGQEAQNRVDKIVTGMGQETLSKVENTQVRQDTLPEVKNTELKEATPPVLPEVTNASKADREQPALYHGEVELAILPPVNAAGLLQFQKMLRESFQLKIVRTHGSPSKGSLVTILLSEPQPLLQDLKQMPEVKEAVDELDTSAQEILPSLFKNKRGKRIWVTLHA